MVVSTVQAQAPANDNFADATIISNAPFTEEVAIAAEASIEVDEPICPVHRISSLPGRRSGMPTPQKLAVSPSFMFQQNMIPFSRFTPDMKYPIYQRQDVGVMLEILPSR